MKDEIDTYTHAHTHSVTHTHKHTHANLLLYSTLSLDHSRQSLHASVLSRTDLGLQYLFYDYTIVPVERKNVRKNAVQMINACRQMVERMTAVRTR